MTFFVLKHSYLHLHRDELQSCRFLPLCWGIAPVAGNSPLAWTNPREKGEEKWRKPDTVFICFCTFLVFLKGSREVHLFCSSWCSLLCIQLWESFNAGCLLWLAGHILWPHLKSQPFIRRNESILAVTDFSFFSFGKVEFFNSTGGVFSSLWMLGLMWVSGSELWPVRHGHRLCINTVCQRAV